MSKTVILPICDDGNRGDQALVWQTREIARRAGLADECAMLTESPEDSPQSRAEGIGLLTPILRHPSGRFSPKSNIRYGKLLVLMWGVISLGDGLRALLLLSGFGRRLFSWTLSREERHTIREISVADACFVKGGGFIHTTGSVTDPYRAFFFLYHVMLAQSLRTPVYIMPNSFGPLNGSLYQWIVRRTLSRCALVTARESVSQQMLREIGIESEVYPDLAFGLRSEPQSTPHLHEARASAGGKPIVGITARPYRFPGSSDPEGSYLNYVAALAEFAKWLYAEEFFPVFIEHVVSTGEHESDISAIQRVTQQLAHGSFAVFQSPQLNCREMKSVYSECDYVVGTRFHSVIFALSEGTPALAIGYGGNKGTGIMTDIGFPDYVIPIEEFTASAAQNAFEKFSSDTRLAPRIDRLKDEVKERYVHLVDTVRGRHGSL